MEETREVTSSLPLLWTYVSEKEKKKENKKKPQTTENQFEYWNVGVLENSSSISLIFKFKFKQWAVPLSLQA